MNASASSAPRTIHLSSNDNVIVAVDTIDKGVSVHGITAIDRVPRGHKMAIKPLAVDEPVIKFGQIIGFASKDVVPGTWLHEHNVGMRDFERDYCYAQDDKQEDILLAARCREKRLSAFCAESHF